MSAIVAQMNQLSQAIEQGKVNEVQRLLEVANAKEVVNMCDSQLYTALFHTTRLGNEDTILQILNILLEKGANPYHKEQNKQTILFYLAKEGRAKVIERLLSSLNYNLNDPDKYNQNPLYWAASHGRLKVAQLLLKYGVNVNHLDQNGQTCLFYAAREGQLQMCKFLVNRGCQFDLVDRNKKTALHFAKTYKHHALVEYFNSLKETTKSKAVKQSKHVGQRQLSISSQNKAKQKKKEKEVQRGEYLFVYTSEDGITREVKGEDLEQFINANQQNAELYEYFLRPEKLEDVDARNQKKTNFLKTATRLVNSYLKRAGNFAFYADLVLFYQPVDTFKYMDYLQHVQRPMDLSTIRQKLNFNCYDTPEEFRDDILLMYDNCSRYNGAESIYGQMVKKLKLQFLETYQKEFMM